MPQLAKECTGCGETDLSKFVYNTYVRKDGTRALRSHCNECRASGTRSWYSSHKEQSSRTRKKYAEENKETLKRKGWEHREKHREEARVRANNHYHTHKRNGTNISSWLAKKYEGVPCTDCDTVYGFHVMDFDHRPEETKSFGIAKKGAHVTTPENLAMVMEEIKKTDLVCSNCHRERTYQRSK